MGQRVRAIHLACPGSHRMSEMGLEENMLQTVPPQCPRVSRNVTQSVTEGGDYVPCSKEEMKGSRIRDLHLQGCTCPEGALLS